MPDGRFSDCGIMTLNCGEQVMAAMGKPSLGGARALCGFEHAPKQDEMLAVSRCSQRADGIGTATPGS
jgi:hypothetical protein